VAASRFKSLALSEATGYVREAIKYEKPIKETMSYSAFEAVHINSGDLERKEMKLGLS